MPLFHKKNIRDFLEKNGGIRDDVAFRCFYEFLKRSLLYNVISWYLEKKSPKCNVSDWRPDHMRYIWIGRCRCHRHRRVFTLYTAFSFSSATNTNRCKGSNSVKVNNTGIHTVVWNKHTDGKQENKQTLIVVSAAARIYAYAHIMYVPWNRRGCAFSNERRKKKKNSTKWYMLFHMSILRTIITINSCFSKRNCKFKKKRKKDVKKRGTKKCINTKKKSAERKNHSERNVLFGLSWITWCSLPSNITRNCKWSNTQMYIHTRDDNWNNNNASGSKQNSKTERASALARRDS